MWGYPTLLILWFINFNVFYKPRFFSKKRWFSKTLKTSYMPTNSFSFLYPSKYFVKQHKDCILMIRKVWSFFDQNFQSVAILDKKLKILIFNFFVNFKSFFSKILSIKIFHSDVAFQRYQIYQILLNVQKVMRAWKINVMNKKHSFSSF